MKIFSFLNQNMSGFANLRNQKMWVLWVLVLFLFALSPAQADELCVDDPDSLAVKRPLLNRVMNIIADDYLKTWTRSNYEANYNSLPGMLDSTGVTLVKSWNAGNEYIDPTRGGITESNILAGLSHSRSIAKEKIPAGVTLLSSPDPVVTLNIKKVRTNYVQGSGWAWNSLMYLHEGVVYEMVYFYHGYYIEEDSEMFLVADNSSTICILKLPAPAADPGGKTFDFIENVRLSNQVPGAEIFYRLNQTDAFTVYTGMAIPITETKALEFFAQKTGWMNSDTVTETYSKTGTQSTLQLSKLTGEPLGGTSNLTENDSKFIIKLTSPYAALTAVTIKITTEAGQDAENVTISNPLLQNNALVFIDTVDFAVASSVGGNGVVEASIYDTVSANWSNPYNTEDNLAAVFLVRPAPKEGKVYFADSNWNELSASLVGTESLLYVVVDDAVFDPARREEYVVTLSNKKGVGNAGSPDREVYPLVEISTGKYGAIISVSPSPPVFSGNGKFEIRIGDELKAGYVNPLSPSEKTDIIGYGIATQQPGQVVFSNEDWTVPPELMSGSIWDAGKGKVFIRYSDDYIASLLNKKAKITVVSTDARGKQSTDTEIINLSLLQRIGDAGVWSSLVVLDDSPVPFVGDGKLQYYFKALITVDVATHIAGSAEILEGDTARAELVTARANSEEQISITDLATGSIPGRTSTIVQVCVQDQLFSSVSVDTLLLDKIECASSGDKLENVMLIQKSPTSTEYCGTVQKQEAVSGTLTDDVLHCQDIDNIISRYTDPVYGTGASKQITIMDPTVAKIQFLTVVGNPVSSYSEVDGENIIVRLIHKSPDLYKIDTLRVKLKTDTGDSLDVLVYESAINSGIFEGIVNVGFTESPNLRNNIIEGKLDPASHYNQMVMTGSKGTANATLTVTAAYVPPKRAWIVDGNGDGQGDSIYITFEGMITELPSTVTSIDWNGEGLQNHSATYSASNALFSEINYGGGSFSTLAILLSGALDENLAVFPQGATSLDGINPPTLVLPEGKWYQGREVTLEDGIGAVVMAVQKHPSDNTYYKDADGYLQKQPDTLHITLSEKIRPVHNQGAPWDSLFSFLSPDMVKSDAYPLVSLPGTQPKVEGPDSLVWIFIVDNGANTIKPFINDELFMNSNAPYVDASPAANRPQGLPQIIMGADNPNPINNSNIFVPVIGTSVNDPRSLSANLYLNDRGQVVPGRDVIMVRNESGSYEYTRMWVKPVGLQGDGTILGNGQQCLSGDSENEGETVYPDNCLSTVQMFSTDAYTAEVAIFDHLGKFIHQSVQTFGYCGELDNHNRRTSQGLQSWLVWNQKDLQGQYVGTGVYIWKVKFTTSAGSHIAVYRQGIVRAGSEPQGGCSQ
ncbi:MAG: hypothetical protein HQK83_15510 [Fibrobacteria bacterium]|nr:hypothetical protein [Fibrobacteria bacterium]